MTTVTATKARQNFFGLIKKSVKSHSPIQVTSKSGNMVLLSQEDYESLIETLEILSVPGMKKSISRSEKDIKSGKVKSMKEVFGR